jgi:hypothetical protein
MMNSLSRLVLSFVHFELPFAQNIANRRFFLTSFCRNACRRRKLGSLAIAETLFSDCHRLFPNTFSHQEIGLIARNAMLRSAGVRFSVRRLNQTPIYQNTHLHLHCPVRVKADQKKGFEKSFERKRVNCASRHAFARDSPARQRRMNSVINRLVALSLTFQ